MSNTKMDLSPKAIERKQDITSWLEGDITQLSTRERSHYQKRKSAIEDYFKTDLSVKEISSRNHLSSDDKLEQLAARCLTLHEDGQPWGFRALLPGVETAQASADNRLTSTEMAADEEAETPETSSAPEIHPQEILDEDEDETAEIQAVRPLVKSTPEPGAPTEVEQTSSEISHEHIDGDDPSLDSPTLSGSEISEKVDLEQVEQPVEIEETDTPTSKLEHPLEVSEKADLELAEQSVEIEETDAPTSKLEHPSEIVGEISTAQKDSDTPTSELEYPDTEESTIPTGKLEQPDNVVEETQEDGEQDETTSQDTVEVITGVSPEIDAEEQTTDQNTIEAVNGSSSEVEAKKEEREQAAAEATETLILPEKVNDAQEGKQAEQTLTAIKQPDVLDNSQTLTTKEKPEQANDVTIIDTTAEVEDEASSAPAEHSRNSRQLAAAQALVAPIQSLIEGGRYRLTGKRAVIKHSVVRRWTRQIKKQRHRKWVQIISAIVIVAVLVVISLPLIAGLIGYNAYNNIKAVAEDGVTNLMAIKSLLPADKSDITSVLDVKKLASAKTSLGKAQGDFLQLQEMVNRSDIESLLQQFAPQYSNQLGMARQLVQVALDVTYMGQELIDVANIGANIIHGSPLAASKPLLTADSIHQVEAVLVHAQYYIGDISARMSQVDLSKLPLGNASQKADLTKYLNMLPPLQNQLTQVRQMIGPIAWLLGVGTARHFLVQTLDRGELRPSGGFEGQYGILTLQDGKMSPFTLTDIAKLDYGGNGAELGAVPPAQYGWMNFGSFGVRDANLSADFPTTAQLVMRYFEQEGGGPVDGVIQITPVIIKQFLHITGPIRVADYNDTITEQNLEDKLHAYQQDSRLIGKQQDISGTDTHQTRKAFTNLVGKLMLDRVKKLSVKQLMDFGKFLLQDLSTRDLQIYFTNTQAEQWLTQNNYSGSMPHFTNGVDGFMVVQANISISKAAQYVKTTFNDQVTLDNKGGATHHMTISLNYQRNGRPIYGFSSYADYLRVYAPNNAQLISAYGFNTGRTLCT
ncbi:MAG TPA: DUF4012 domain-containing protein, partial [Ktedonobacteraceae bacterium]|nr:DUF4012 domain-containing protein [Ktedonobacteraceae bacterium]